MLLFVYIGFSFVVTLAQAGEPKHKIHVKIHVPVSIHKHRHTNTVYLHGKPKAKPSHQHYQNYFQKSSGYSASSNFGKAALIRRKKPNIGQQDLIIAKLVAQHLVNPQNLNKNVHMHHHAYVTNQNPGFNQLIRHGINQNILRAALAKIYQNQRGHPDAELFSPRLNQYDSSYVVGSGYQVEEFPPYDTSTSPYKAFNSLEHQPQKEEEGYMDPEKITEYISFIQKGYLNEEDDHFGSDQGDESSKFADGSFDEANEHAGSEYSGNENHLKHGEHGSSEYNDTFSKSKIS